MSRPPPRRRPSVAAPLYLTSWLIPLMVAGHTWLEHSRRVDVLTNGREVAGEVTEAARQRSGRLSTCEVDYAFELDDRCTRRRHRSAVD